MYDFEALLRYRTLTGISIQVERSGTRGTIGPSSHDLEGCRPVRGRTR